MSIGEYCPSQLSYCTRKLVQYDILFGTIFTNIHAITLYYWQRTREKITNLPQQVINKIFSHKMELSIYDKHCFHM